MTIKEISELTGKSHQTMGRWIKLSISKMDTIKSKMDKGNTSNPANFNLDETICIIKSGGNNLLADLLLHNAQEKENLPAVIEEKQESAMLYIGVNLEKSSNRIEFLEKENKDKSERIKKLEDDIKKIKEYLNGKSQREKVKDEIYKEDISDINKRLDTLEDKTGVSLF